MNGFFAFLAKNFVIQFQNCYSKMDSAKFKAVICSFIKHLR